MVIKQPHFWLALFFALPVSGSETTLSYKGPFYPFGFTLTSGKMNGGGNQAQDEIFGVSAATSMAAVAIGAISVFLISMKKEKNFSRFWDGGRILQIAATPLFTLICMAIFRGDVIEGYYWRVPMSLFIVLSVLAWNGLEQGFRYGKTLRPRMTNKDWVQLSSQLLSYTALASFEYTKIKKHNS